MTRHIAVLALALGLPVTAHAQSWTDFSGAFPLFPCQDGWMGCLVDGRSVSPDMDTETGTPTPTTLRVDWFDLRPTATFSPFVRLSQYTGELPGMAAADVGDAPEVAPEPAPPPQPSAEEIAAQQDARRAREEASRMEAERREAEAAAKRATAEQEEQRRAAAAAERRKLELEAQAKSAADAAEAERLRKQAEEEARKAREAEEARKRAEAEAKKAEEERLAKLKAEEDARKKAEEEAARLAALEAEAAKKRAEEEAARKKAEEEERRKAEEAAKVAAAAAAANGSNDAVADAGKAPPPEVSASATCEVSELVKFEPQAMLGKMSLAQTKACESSLAASAKMTDKEKISRLLMANANAKGDKANWEQLIKRHLDEIDQSDPDLCYKYALHLSQQGAGRATGVIRWANVALENRTVWTGDTYTARVNSLYKLRAAAANTLWQKSEGDHASSPTDDTKKKVDDFRNQTKVLAREWYEYAKLAGKESDATKALQLCMSAAGTATYCEAG